MQVPNDRWLESDTVKSVLGASGSKRGGFARSSVTRCPTLAIAFPMSGHAYLERRFLIIPGIRSSRIYVIDTHGGPMKARIHKIIEPEEVFAKTGYSRPHTVHCGPEGIYVSTLGGGGRDVREPGRASICIRCARAD